MNRTICFWILLGLCYTKSVIAQTNYTFDQCLEMALKNNLTIQNQYLNEELSKNNLKSAQYKLLPSVSGYLNGSGSWGRGIDPFTNTYANQQFNTYNGGVNANLVLFNGLYNINNIKLQKQDLEVNRSSIQKAKNDLTIDLAMKYTNVLYYRELVKTLGIQLEISKKNIELTQQKIKEGSLAKNDLYKLIAQKELEESNLIAAKNQLELNLIDLKQIMNLPLESMIEIEDFPYTIESAKRYQQDPWTMLDQAVRRHPSTQINKWNIEKSKTALKLSESAYYPTITLGANTASTYSTFNKWVPFEDQLHNNLNYSLSLNANISIFNQMQTRSKVKEASINIKKAELNAKIEKQSISKTILQAMNNLTASEKKYQASKASYEANKINFESDKIKYEVGRIGVSEINLNKANFFTSHANLIKDKYEFLFNYFVVKFYMGE
jgi:outer membrane protein